MIAAIVVAAGQGTRFGGNTPKQFLMLRDRPLLAHSLLRFERHPAVGEIVLVTAPAWQSHIRNEILSRFDLRKVGDLVAGGAERQDSVAAGLQAIKSHPEFIAVHDAVRPLFSMSLFERVLAGCRQADACIPAVALRDTVKQIENGMISRTLPRERLRLAQTPQIFRSEVLRRAFSNADLHALRGTDEAALVEAVGGRVAWVEGDERNLKITSPLDLQIAELLCDEDQ